MNSVSFVLLAMSGIAGCDIVKMVSLVGDSERRASLVEQYVQLEF